MEKVEYKGWKNCIRLANGKVELIATTDVGPRIIRFGMRNGENEFKEYADQVGTIGGEEWKNYGGHRLWHAPEDKSRTYFPDTRPVEFQDHGAFLRLTQTVETTTGIQKELDIFLDPQEAHVRIVHRLRNCGLWSIELAPWALSVMEAGGTAILPIPPRVTHEQSLLPTGPLVLWGYTNLSDPRWVLGKKYILLRQDSAQTEPQKLGLQAPDGWIAYVRNGRLFVIRTAYIEGAKYPDCGSSLETYASARMLELETLGPIQEISPKSEIEHVEDWYLYENVPVPTSDGDVEMYILPKVRLASSVS